MTRSMRRTMTMVAAVALAMLSSLPAAFAAPSVSTNPVDRGWWDGDGIHLEGHANYCVGDCGGSARLRNFFVFDIPDSEYAIVEATLAIRNGNGGGDLLDYAIHQVKTPVSEVRAEGIGSAHDRGIYRHLGDGMVLGHETPTNVDAAFVNVDLSSRGLLYLSNHQDSRIVFGGVLEGAGLGDFLFADSVDYPVGDVDFYYYWGYPTHLSLNAPSMVDPGDRVRFRGAITAPTNHACVEDMTLEVKVGDEAFDVSTDTDGHYEFTRRIHDRTKVSVFFEEGPDYNCGAAEAKKTIRVS